MQKNWNENMNSEKNSKYLSNVQSKVLLRLFLYFLSTISI